MTLETVLEQAAADSAVSACHRKNDNTEISTETNIQKTEAQNKNTETNTEITHTSPPSAVAGGVAGAADLLAAPAHALPGPDRDTRGQRKGKCS